MKTALVPFLFIALIVVYGIGLFTDVMELDAAQYAAMSIEMLERGNYLQLTDHGNDYLDKPPLTFWLASLSYTLFGISNVSYKLPSLLFALLGLFATYRLATLFYEKKVAIHAALILGSCQAFFLLNQDCRTDTLLMGAVAFALWQLMAYLQQGKWYYLVGGFTGIGLAMLAKGPIGIVVPVFGLGVHLIATKQWRSFFKWQWIIGLGITGLLLVPMTIGLYQQFGWEGIRFYYWVQSFGRITGESEWNNDGGFSLFFVHTSLWAFLPWSLIWMIALGKLLVDTIKRRPLFIKEHLTWGGMVLTFIALSFSKFKLPHYIFVIYPLMAIFTAAYLHSLEEKPWLKRWLPGIQLFLVGVLILGVPSMVAISFELHWAWALVITPLTLFSAWLYFAESGVGKILYPACVAMIVGNLLANGIAYPAILKYQAPSQLGYYVREQDIPINQLYNYTRADHSLYFALQQTIPRLNLSEITQKAKSGETFYLHVDDRDLKRVKDAKLPHQVVYSFEHFHVTKLSLNFLLPSTRHHTLTHRYLLQFN